MIGINLYKMKKCYKCKEMLLLNNFCKDRSRKDGLAHRCKKCSITQRKKYYKKYYKDNKEKELKRQKEYYRDNKEKLKAYRKNNKEKIAKRNKKYREDNKEKIKAYYKDNKEKINERKKAYYKDNKEKIKEQKKAYQKDNLEKFRAASKKYYKNNKEKESERKKEYRRNNPEIRRAASRRRRARKLAVNENYTKDHETATMIAFNYKCHNCGSTEDLCIDHHRPLSTGNPLSLNNAVVLCKTCNSSKGTNTPEQFYDQVKLINANFKMNLSTFIYKDL